MIATATAILLFAQIDPLPPPPPPAPGQPFQPAQPSQPQAPAQKAPPARPAQRPAPAPYRAGPAPGPRQAPAPYVKPDRPTPPPFAHRGFQLGIRTGAALPAGRLAEDTAMNALASAQIPAFLDIGAKISRHVFIGGYASFALGGTSDRWQRICFERDACSSRAIHLGAQIQYHFAPAERANPWLGYGIGYEWLWTAGAPETTFRGPEYGRFMAGLDFRLSHDWGLGPFVDATLARYTDTSRGGGGTQEIADTAIHSWVTVGLRLVLFP